MRIHFVRCMMFHDRYVHASGRMLVIHVSSAAISTKHVCFASPNIEFGSVPARHVSFFVVALASYLSGNSGLPRCYRGTPHSRLPPVFTLEIVHTLRALPTSRRTPPRSEAPLLARSFVFSGVDSHSLYIGDWRSNTVRCCLQWPRPEDKTMEVCPWKRSLGARLQDGDLE